MEKNIINQQEVIADDMGLSDGINAGVVDLLKKQKCCGASVVMGPHFSYDSIVKNLALLKMSNIGIHLNFSTPKLSNIYNVNKISNNISEQLDAFDKLFQQEVKHIDSHHHIHQLPIHIVVLVSVLKKRFNKGYMPIVRNTCINPLFIFKSWKLFSAKELVNMSYFFFIGLLVQLYLKYHRIPTNDFFWGYYDLKRPHNFKQKLEAYFNYPKKNTDIFAIHPGIKDSSIYKFDSINTQRETEYQFFLNL